jgi:hypothetical protein
MQISEQELRDMIRDAIARQRSGGARTIDVSPQPALSTGIPPRHPSHVLFAMVPSGDGECIIEPTVQCNHCGYCQSLGH